MEGIDIKELNKTQLVLVTLLITFVVSIATGIVTVSLMQQAPKSVPQTINNVIQRTIEKVTTVPAPVTTTTDTSTKDTPILGDGDAVISIYPIDKPTAEVPPVATPSTTSTPDTTTPTTNTTPENTTTTPETTKALGQGIIISDMGLILVDSSILTDSTVYKVILNKTDFDATILKKFSNGFSILKITPKKEKEITPKDKVISKVDIKQ